MSKVSAILPIPGVPDELLKAVNDRMRLLGQTQVAPSVAPKKTATTLTADTVPKQGTGALTDSAISDNGSTVTISESLNVTGSISRSGVDTFGFPAAYASVAQTGKTSAITTTNIQHAAAILPAGVYLVALYLFCSATGTANVGVTLGWHDGAAAQTNVLGPAGMGTLGQLLAGVYCYRLDGAHDLTYATSDTGTGTYALYIDVLRLT